MKHCLSHNDRVPSKVKIKMYKGQDQDVQRSRSRWTKVKIKMFKGPDQDGQRSRSRCTKVKIKMYKDQDQDVQRSRSRCTLCRTLWNTVLLPPTRHTGIKGNIEKDTKNEEKKY